VRFADVVLRGGHLAEQALIEAVMTGERPIHLDRCDLCAERAVELGRWLDDVRAMDLAAADAAFPAERLTAQQTQIMRRLEQLDEPARVIAFPSQYRLPRESSTRKVAPAWLGVAAAAGLILGVFGGQWSAHLNNPAVVAPVQPSAIAEPTSTQPGPDAAPLTAANTPHASWLDTDQNLDRITVPTLQAFDEATPTANVVYAANVRQIR
jgi:hypothetical protein